MNCIYCRTSTTENSGKAHVFPEALAQNRLTIPRGAVCNQCNNYIGIRLDQNLVRYPLIAFAIQFVGTSGKRGKTTSRIGTDTSCRRNRRVQTDFVTGKTGTACHAGRKAAFPGSRTRRFRV